MTINPKINDELENAFPDTAQRSMALLYLLATYFSINDSIIPMSIVRAVNLMKIVERDYEGEQVKWNTPLFLNPEGQNPDTNWEWVEVEYRTLFKSLRGDAGGDSKAVLTKMKKFFAENPQVRKDDVILATKAYLIDFREGRQNTQYLQRADYFISKKTEGVPSSRLMSFVEQVRKDDTGNDKGGGRYMQGIVD